MKTNDNSGWEWSRIREEKLAQNRRDNDGRCEATLYGCLGFAEEVHHVVSRVDGGGDNDGLLALCSACHTRFTTATVRERALVRREAKRQARRKNHPGRKDRHDG
jgi:5-methylcytosine-specific restriction endonuclease McrA